ncbi:hypothetical protein KR222_007147, partial [Zaprionus bogoriensis]
PDRDHLLQLPLFVFALVLACSCALPVDEEKPVVEILHSQTDQKEDGSYNLSYATADGISRDENAALSNPGTDEEALEVNGSYSYFNENGEEVKVYYTAGVNGFVPRGSVIDPK